MKTILMTMAASAGVLFASSAQGWGVPNVPAMPGAPAVPSVSSASRDGGATPEDIDSFLTTATVADVLVNEASLCLFRAVASKEQIERYEALVKAASAIQDPKEKQAKMEQANASVQATLLSADYAKTSEQLVAEANAKKNEATASAIYNLALGGLKDSELVSTGHKLVSGVPSAAVADRVPLVSHTLARLRNQAQGLTKVMGRAKLLMSAVGLEALPTRASDAPRKITI
jgi:hypothetical protein